MPQFVVWAVAAIGSYIGGVTGAMMIMYATEIAAAAILLGSAALSGAQASRAKRQARDAYNASQVDRMLNVVTTVGPRELVMGRVRKAGTVFFRGSTGANKETFVMLVALAGHEIDAVEAIYLNEELVTLDGDSYVTSDPYALAATATYTETISGSSITLAHAPLADSVTVSRAGGDGYEIIGHTLAGSVVTLGDSLGGQVTYQSTSGNSKARIRAYLGTDSQAADDAVMDLFPDDWTADHRARGVAYLVCEFTYDETAFPSGMPSVSAVVRGAKLYDPRDDTTAWSENPALMARHLLTHESFGKRTSLTAAEDARIAAAANACDTSHGYVVDGVTDTRALFTAGYVLPYGAPAKDALDDVCQAMGGMWAYAGGEFFIRAGVYTASVMTLTEADLAVVKRSSDGSVQQQPIVIGTHQARADKVNTITPRIWDQDQHFKQVALTPLAPAALLARDGATLAREIDMPAITYSAQALHVAGIIMRDERDPLRVTLPFKLRAYPVELFDNVSLTLARYGWSAKVFTVLGRSWTLDGLLQLTLKETAASIYQADASFEPQGGAANTHLPRPWDIQPPTVTSVESGVAHLQQLADGTQVPRVRVTWAAITDFSLINGGQVEVQFRDSQATDWESVVVPAVETGAYLLGLAGARVVFIRVRSRNSVAVSDWGVLLAHEVEGNVDAPAAPTSLAAAAILRGIRVSWVNPTDPDLRHVQVWMGTTATLAEAAKVAEIAGTAYDHVNLYASDGPRYYWVCAVDTTGNLSAYVGPVNATAAAVEVADLDPAVAAEVEPPDLTEPPGPTGFAVSAALSHIFVEHDAPAYTEGHGHAKTRLYGVQYTGGALPEFAAADLLAEFTGTIYAYPSALGTTWRLWIKWVSVDGVPSATPAGGTNGLSAATGVIGNADLGPQIIEAGNLAAGAVQLSAFASTIRPIEILSELPSTDNFQGRTVYLTTDDKIYRHTGAPSGSAGFTRATDGADILAGSIVANSIQAGAVTAVKLAANAIAVGTAAIQNGAIVNAMIGAAAIDSAKIADASIVSAKINDLAVTTLKIGANAVTVPITSSRHRTVSGAGLETPLTIAQGYISLDYSGIVHAQMIGAQYYGQGLRTWWMQMHIGSYAGPMVGGEVVEVAPAIALSTGLEPGTHEVKVLWWGQDEGIRIGSTELLILGSKR